MRTRLGATLASAASTAAESSLDAGGSAGETDWAEAAAATPLKRTVASSRRIK